MDNNWKQDPRLMAMDPEKVSLLMEFAEKTAHTDQSQLMPHFLHICQEANAKGLQFTNSETALLVDILSCHMPEKTVKNFRFLSWLQGRSQAGSINRLLASFRCIFFYTFLIIAFLFYICYSLPMRQMP